MELNSSAQTVHLDQIVVNDAPHSGLAHDIMPLSTTTSLYPGINHQRMTTFVVEGALASEIVAGVEHVVLFVAIFVLDSISQRANCFHDLGNFGNGQIRGRS